MHVGKHEIGTLPKNTMEEDVQREGCKENGAGENEQFQIGEFTPFSDRR
jgi:hypothetical protein